MKSKRNDYQARWDIIPSGTVFQAIILSMLLCFCFQPTYSQEGFNETYDIGVSARFISVETFQQNICVSGFYRNSVGAFQSGFIALFDTLGDMQWWVEISDSTSSITMNEESKMLVTEDYEIVRPFVYFNRSSFGTIQVDSTGQILSMREFPRDAGSVTSPRSIEETNDGFMVTGWTSKPPLFRTDAFILKTDRMGNMKWLKDYGHPSEEENSRSISFINSNLSVISGTRYQIEDEPFFYHGWAFAIDSLGNKKWEWEASEEEIPHRGILSMQYDSVNSEWVYMSFLEKPVFIKELGFNVDMQIPVFVRRDSIMQLISYQEYGPYSLRHDMGVLESSNDGSWLAAGSFSCVTEDSPQNCDVGYGRVIKISNDVDTILWSVKDTAFYHPEHGSDCYLSGVTESSSGSVYAVGWANHYDENEVYRSFGWLLKITKDGCVDTLCTTTSLLEQIERREKKIHVNPNPTTDYLIFEIAEGVDVAHAEIYDLSGRRIQFQKMPSGTSVMLLDDGRYSSGMYVWRVVDERGRQVGVGKVFVE